jgi:hypothetical protein
MEIAVSCETFLLIHKITKNYLLEIHIINHH